MSTDPAAQLVGRLIERGETLALAESCTGGGICAAVTGVPGSSSAFWGGIVSYANDAKMSLLDVPPALIEAEGAVSPGVAKSMAWGMRGRSGADWTCAVTGIAGPDGGTPDKPVGTVWFGYCDPSGNVSARSCRFDGDRAGIRAAAVETAIRDLMDLLDSTDSNNDRRIALDS